ncbi:MAG: hypothetical protein OXC70_01505 [Gammaproteobacteria bacterium]|nr:hypothetical protein [Gammaproteobacteria bacterium]
MTAIRALIEALGADYRQWRGLVRPLMQVSYRLLQDSMQAAGRGNKARPVSWFTMFMMLMFGVFIANLAGMAGNAFSLSLAALTYVAVTVLYLLLQNFRAVTVTPQDYEVLGHRPVSPRTYLIARLTVIMAQQAIMTTLLAVPVALACGFRFGWMPALALLLAAFLLVFCAVLLAISTFATVIENVGGDALARALTWAQVALLAFYLGPLFFEEWATALFDGFGSGPQGWLLALPTAWFAGLASLAAGEFTVGAWACLLAALGSGGGLAWFARNKLSLASGRKFASMAVADAKSRSAGRFTGRFRPGERRLGPAATLAWRQLRHDMRLRMGMIGTVPLFALYFIVSLQMSGPVDPFVPGANALGALALVGIHASVIMAPALLLEQLYSSESWRAAWVFYATPANRAHIAARVRHFVTICFFLPYLFLAAIGLAWRFEEAWHALVHVLLLGGLGVLIMQVAQFLWPRLPFALPHNRPRAPLPSFLTLLGCLVLAVGLAFYASFAYARPAWAIGTFAAVAMCLAGMEWILPARLNRRLRWL